MNTVLRLHAYFTSDYSRTPGVPQGFELNATLPTKQEAIELAALFPKSAKVYAGTLSNGYDGVVRGWVAARANLLSDGVNGGINETGLRRYRAILKTAAKLGIGIEYVPNAGNAYPTREAFEAAIA